MLISRLAKLVLVLLALVGLATVITVIVLYVSVVDLAHAAWRPPVSGGVTRSYDPGSRPFEARRHRGVDLAAAPGTKVRAPCTGAVAFAGRVGSSGRVVTLRCGRWRVTHMPLASIGVRAGAAITRGALLGTVAASADHAGLHLGVRRDGTRFGYADPLRFLATGPMAPPPLGRPPRAARPPRAGRPPRAARPPRGMTPRPRAPVPRPVSAGSNRAPATPLAPWPAWLGLALALAGAGVRWRGRGSRRCWRVRAAGTLTR
jgi:hypothetical protein